MPSFLREQACAAKGRRGGGGVGHMVLHASKIKVQLLHRNMETIILQTGFIYTSGIFPITISRAQ